MSQETLINSTNPEEQIPQSPGTARFYRVGLAYGHAVHRFRWLILALWLVAIVASVPLAIKIGSVLQGGGYTNEQSESARASQLLGKKLNLPDTSLLVVFQATNTPLNDPAYQQEVTTFVAQVKTFSHVSDIEPGSAGRDGHTTYVVVNFSKGNTISDHISDFRMLLPTSPAHTYLGGDAITNQEYIDTVLKDAVHSKVLALPIALVLLLIVFGTLIAGLMPLLLAMVAVIVSLALIYLIGLVVPTGSFVLNVVTVTGLGISIDYSLFIVRRFRDELKLGRSIDDAIAWTVATAGESILFSGLTVMIGFTGLLVIGVQFLNSFGIGGVVVVGAAVIAALTLLPAVLAVLGTRINALRIPFLSRFVGVEPRYKKGIDSAVEAPIQRGFWHNWALGVMRRPVLVMLVSLALLIVLGWPVFSLNIGTPNTSALPKGAESRLAYDLLYAQFPQFNVHPIQVVVQSADGSSMLTADNLAKLNSLSHWLGVQQYVTSVVSLTQLPTQASAQTPSELQLVTLYSTGSYQRYPALVRFVASTTGGDTSLITVQTNAAVDSDAAKALINHLRSDHANAAQGLKVLVGGYQASSMDFTAYLYGNFPLAIAFILITTFVLLTIMFRSLLLPLQAIVMNVLSVGVAYGVLVFVFQWGHFQNVFNFTASGFIDSPVPLLMFCTLFGLSMDYEVFLLSRVREEWLHTHDNAKAVAHGLEKTGGVITNAALLFIIIAGASIFTSLVMSQEYGLGMVVAVLVDATIIRTLLVPATMRLLGRWNWWFPGRGMAK